MSLDFEELYVEAASRLAYAEEEANEFDAAYWQGQLALLQRILDQEEDEP